MSEIRKRVQRNSSFSDSDFNLEDKYIDDKQSSKVEENDAPKPKAVTLRSVVVRTIAASILALLFLVILRAGHFYIILATVLCQTEIYRELVNVRYVEARDRSIPWFRTLQWSWFFVAMFSVYGENLHNFCTENKRLFFLTHLTQYSQNFSFILYCVVFVASVATLKKTLLRFQISQYMWAIITICVVVYQCKYAANNTLNGLFWFFFPFATVAFNDVSAYFCGITMGKKFISGTFLTLSPNKTWEGKLNTWHFRTQSV
jgi:phosphatidate cytidylyltransferase